MKKYLLVLKNSISESIVYRLNTFALIFTHLFIFGVMFYLWSSIYRQGGQVGSYTFKQIVIYYLTANFIGIIIYGEDIARAVGEEIRTGEATNLLLKPVSYLRYTFFSVLGGAIYRLAICFVIFGVLAASLSPRLGFNFDLTRTVFFGLFLVLSFLIYFFIFYIVGISAFWFKYIKGLNAVLLFSTAFLQGAVIPLDLLPKTFTFFNNFLPFKYAIFVPVAVLTGRQEVNLQLFLAATAWLLALLLMAVLIFKRGVKKYEAVGV